jgi:Cellulose biosynthesis protein BcsN
MRHLRLLSALAAASSALAGCSMFPFEDRAAFESTTDLAPAARPMAQLPAGAGEQISVLQSNLQGPLTQKIVLQGDPATGGENRIIVIVDRDQLMPGESDYKVPKPTEELIAKELDDTMPGIAMAISQYFVRNDFGPFGYAIGHAYGGVACIYAWQWAPGQPIRLIANPEAQAAEASRPKWPTSVRVRLCKQGLGEAELVELVHQMAIYPPGSTTPYLDMTYGARPSVNADSLSSSGVPRAFYLGGADPLLTAPPHRRLAMIQESVAPVARHRRHRHRWPRDEGAVDRNIYEPVSVSPLAGRGVSVPLPGEGGKAGAAGSNALLAPLQRAQPASASARAATSDLPLPPAVGGQSSASAPLSLPAPQ